MHGNFAAVSAFPHFPITRYPGACFRLLPHGRGNVKSDILATGSEASRRYLAGWNLEDNYLKKKGLFENPEPDFEKLQSHPREFPIAFDARTVPEAAPADGTNGFCQVTFDSRTDPRDPFAIA